MTVRLTAQQEKFLAAYLSNGGKAADAYRAAYDCEGLSDVKLGARASYIVNKTRVRQAIADSQQRVITNAEFTALDVLKEWIAIATADANELSQHRRNNCRHCHGKSHLWQWRDREEFAVAFAEHLDRQAAEDKQAAMAGRERKELKAPSEAGGYGFLFNARPRETCPRCLGEGHGEVFIADTRFVSDGARKLYVGTKRTKDGIEIKVRDQDAALANIAKFFGMLKNEPGASAAFNFGNGGAAKPLEIPATPMEAMDVYRALMTKVSP